MIAPTVAFEGIAESNLLALIENGVSEQRTIEYKRELPAGGDEARRDFLGYASSFANAGGGDPIFGIEAQDGVPVRLQPLQLNPDQDALRFEQMIRDGVSPRVPGVRIRAVAVTGGHVHLIRVPRSWAGPHAVIYKGAFRFYSRTSAGKYPLDVGELRSAFLSGTALGEQIRAFRAERLATLVSGESPVLLADGPKIVVHLVPYQAFATSDQVELNAQAGSGLFQPLFSAGGTERWNIDGLLTYVERPWDPLDMSMDTRNRVIVYSQLFRNGIFEGVDTDALAPMDSDEDPPRMYAYWFEKSINKGLANPVAVLARLGVEPPIAVLVSVIGARGHQVMRGPQPEANSHTHFIDRDLLVLPDVVIESYPQDYRLELPRLLRPVVDAFWQAGGWSRSNGYDGEGNWVEQR